MLSWLKSWGSPSNPPTPSKSSTIMVDTREICDSLYELHRPNGTPSMQVLFFHGLQLGEHTNTSLSTWESGDGSCIWPETWLVEEFPGAHILCVLYEGYMGKSAPRSVGDMYIIGENITTDLMQKNIGQVPYCPVILVGHSFGGLVIKQVCYEAHETLQTSQGSHKDKLQTFLDNLKGIFYYATPHHGSLVVEKGADLIGGPLLNYFKLLSTDTARLNDKFDRSRTLHPEWRIHGLGESLPTHWGIFGQIFIVPEASARVENFNVVGGVDHFSICKPKSKSERSFFQLKDFLTSIANMKEESKAKEDLRPQNFQYVPQSVTAIDFPVQEIVDKLVNTSVLGLVGMGGSGKTTLAMVVFNKLSPNFEYGCFVPDVKLVKGNVSTLKEEVWKSMHHLGKKVGSKEDWSELDDKQLLLVLDDISEDRDGRLLLEIAQACDSRSCFILTSRDRELLQDLGEVYEVPFLNKRNSVQLFMKHAFPNHVVAPVKFARLMETIVNKCEGLPLTLEVIGKYLKAQGNEEDWRQTLDAVDKAEDVKKLDDRLWAKLKLSYDGLGAKEQQIFLDAAAFFSGNKNWTLGEVKAAWRVVYDTGVERLFWQTLVNMSLVYDIKDDENIKMHEQLRSLGRRIASEQSKCRVRDTEVGFKLLQTPNKFNDQEILALSLGTDCTHGEEMVHIPSTALQRLKKLQYLEVDHGVVIDGAQECESFSTNLVLLKCGSPDFAHVLFHLAPHNQLVVLKLSWDCLCLPVSVWNLSALKIFFLKDFSLQTIPNEIQQLSRLEHLEFDCCCLKQLPETFGQLSNLKRLKFVNCASLKTLPQTFGELSALTHLEFLSCHALTALPESFGQLQALTFLKIHQCTSLCTLPKSFGQLSALNHLEFVACDELNSLPKSFGQLSSLSRLEFRSCDKLNVSPESLDQLKVLRHLKIVACSQLHILRENLG